jgi:hypothetical protein
VDGNVATSTSPGGELTIDTGSFTPGAHTLRVRGYDWTGQYDSPEHWSIWAGIVSPVATIPAQIAVRGLASTAGPLPGTAVVARRTVAASLALIRSPSR